MAGMKVVVVKNKDNGEIDMDDLLKKADKHADRPVSLSRIFRNSLSLSLSLSVSLSVSLSYYQKTLSKI